MCDHVIFIHHDLYTLDVWQTTLTTLVYFCKELYLQENVDKQLGIVENVKICITDKFNKLTFWRSMFYPMFKFHLVHSTITIKILYHDPKVQKSMRAIRISRKWSNIHYDRKHLTRPYLFAESSIRWRRPLMKYRRRTHWSDR